MPGTITLEFCLGKVRSNLIGDPFCSLLANQPKLILMSKVRTPKNGRYRGHHSCGSNEGKTAARAGRGLVRIGELAKIISVSTRTIENWIKKGLISIIQIDGVNLFDPVEVIRDLKHFEQPGIARREGRIASLCQKGTPRITDQTSRHSGADEDNDE